jgi:hypothetical protein
MMDEETLLARLADFGESTCPICGRTVKAWDGCFLPACGCFGDDSSPANPHRPCERCGMQHVKTCPNFAGNDSLMVRGMSRRGGRT